MKYTRFHTTALCSPTRAALLSGRTTTRSAWVGSPRWRPRHPGYPGYVAGHLSDRVRHFFTINEFSTFVQFGHGIGLIAPGLKLPPAELNQVRHHAVLGHGLAVQAIQAQARSGTKVAPAEQVIDVEPVVETAEHIEAARVAMRELNAGYLTVMLRGRPLDGFARQPPRRASVSDDWADARSGRDAAVAAPAHRECRYRVTSRPVWEA